MSVVEQSPQTPHAERPQGPPQPPAEPLDLREKGGVRNGERQPSDRRLFMQLQVFTGARDTAPLSKALEGAGVAGVLYADANDCSGVAILSMSEDPAFFIDTLRPVFQRGAFEGLRPRPEFSMLGRTYALGYEPNLEDWLLQRPRRTVLDHASAWAVWYPLRRTGAFSLLSHQEQGQILKEHGTIGRAFGDAGLASDIRLACTGLDAHDNDFVIGLIGKDLFPLSALIAAMRPTKQTSTYIQNMGPFFVGKALWRSPAPAAPAGR